MALVRQEGARAFCIDKTEVSRAQYREFVGSGERPTTRAACKDNPSFEPDRTCFQLENPCTSGDCDARPQVCVDYCDAEAFCAWSGKTLCGTDDGKELTPETLSDPWATVWQRSCRGMTKQGDKGTAYPYGDQPSIGTCNVAQREQTGCKSSPSSCTSVAVGSLAECHSRGAYAEVHDLGGNVSEYLYAAVPSSLDGRLLAQIAGDNYIAYADDTPETCGNNRGVGGIPLNEGREFLGFRCCAVPK